MDSDSALYGDGSALFPIVSHHPHPLPKLCKNSRSSTIRSVEMLRSSHPWISIPVRRTDVRYSTISGVISSPGTSTGMPGG